MDATKIPYCTLLVLLCCQFGVSYRIYILPEPGAFCLGVLSGDDCIPWSEYSATPTTVYHSTTLIFTPGNYSLLERSGAFSVANIKTFIMIGDRAQLQFQLSLSNIGYVGIHNLSFPVTPNRYGFYIQDVNYIMMENCILSRILESPYRETTILFTMTRPVYYSIVNIANNTFENVLIDVRSYSTLIISNCTFTEYLGSVITAGDYRSSVIIQSSQFTNNFVPSGNLVSTQHSLTVADCLFDSNHINTGSNTAGTLYSSGNISVTNSNFTDASGGAYAIVGFQNVNISDCTFRNHIQSSSVVYNPTNSQPPGDFGIYITNSKFYNCSRPIHAYGHVSITAINAFFFNSIASSGGGVVFSRDSVTLINCTIVNSITGMHGDGGAIYSEGRISLLNSLLVNTSARSGGALYSSQSVAITNCSIMNSYATGNGGAIYGNEVSISNSILRGTVATLDGGAVYCSIHTITAVNSSFTDCSAITGNGGAIYSGSDVTVVNSTLSDCSTLNGNGGAIFSASSQPAYYYYYYTVTVLIMKSTFNNNTAISGGVLYNDGRYPYNMEFSNSTFTLNEALGSGGVACIRNTTLLITNGVLKDNIAAAGGGVLDLSFSSVSIQLWKPRSALFLTLSAHSSFLSAGG